MQTRKRMEPDASPRTARWAVLLGCMLMAAAPAACTGDGTDDDAGDAWEVPDSLDTEDAGDSGDAWEADDAVDAADAGEAEDIEDAGDESKPDASSGAWVEILAPAAGEEVVNPVEIRFAAGVDVQWVSIEVDAWPLHDDLLAADLGATTYSFSGVGFERNMVVAGYDADRLEIATDEVLFTPVNPPLVFPIADRPELILSKFDSPGSSAEFGSSRSGGRVHAGCDLYWTHDGGYDYQTAYYAYNNDTPVYAVADGIIVNYYAFYNGTNALEVDHDDFTVRYGEVDDGGLPGGLGIGSTVSAGQQIAVMGDLDMSSGTWSMLHFELYSNDLTGPLTDTSNWTYLNVPDANYQRRGDLMDCRPFLRGILE
ncbi:MAG: M23 family metallopeptidase [Pseudomonadota bacterium]